MDRRLANLKDGFTNIRNELQRVRIDRLMRTLEEVAESYKTNSPAGAMKALDAVMAFLHDERLEAPFRYLVDVLDKTQRRGRRTKPLDTALTDARLAATVDAVMNIEGKSLEQACNIVARKAYRKMTGKQLKDLREHIRRGKARTEATKLYYRHIRQDWGPSDDPPAPLIEPRKASRKRNRQP